MKRTVKFMSVVLVVLVSMLCFVGCTNNSGGSDVPSSENNSSSGNTSSDSTENTKKRVIETESQAIQAVKSDSHTTKQIARKLGFNNYYSPDYGVCSAYFTSIGEEWRVTLKGSMSGYVDEYHDDFETYQFIYETTVDPETGHVYWYGSVSRV